MQVKIFPDYESLSQHAATEITNLIRQKPNCVLGLATGSTPLGLYRHLVSSYQRQEISFHQVMTFNLDEYLGLGYEHPQSYVRFMWENLFSHIDMHPQHIHIPNGMTENPGLECERYNQLLSQIPIDLQILGIGANGHIGFNEPGTSKDSQTHVVKLSEKTRLDNARFFASLVDVPKYAITMGIANILTAKKIIIMASGKNKAEAVKRMLKDEPSEMCPASFLQHHFDVLCLLDNEAASLL